MKTLKAMAVFALALLITLITGCGKSESGGDSSSGNKPSAKAKKVIGISVMTTTNPFFDVLAKAAKEEAEKHGYEVIIFSGDKDISKQAKQVRDFITQKVDAIILSPVNTQAIGAPIKEANAAGIPVFTADTGCADKTAKVISNITTDNYDGGKLAGKGMIEALDGKGGKVLILDFKEAQSCILRVKGFKEVIEEYNSKNPNAKIEIVAEMAGKASEEPSKKVTEDQLNANPDLAGIFAINDPSALGAVVALKQAGKLQQVKVIAFDGMPRGKMAIKKGEIFAEPVQFPREIGRMTVQKIIEYKKGMEVKPEVLIPTKLYYKADADKDPELEGK